MINPYDSPEVPFESFESRGYEDRPQRLKSIATPANMKLAEQTPLQSEFTRQDGLIMEINMALQRLEERLCPVLSKDDDSIVADSMRDLGFSSDVVRTVFMNNNRLSDTIHRINNISARVEA